MGGRPGSGDAAKREIERCDDGSYTVAGVADVEDFRNETGIQLPSGPYDTLGGYVLTLFGKIPETGESITGEGATFTIVDSDDVHIKRLVIHPIKSTHVRG